MRFIIVAFLFSCFVAFPARAAGTDLSIVAGDISFSKNPLVAGDRVRLYAAIKNPGTEDVSGYVSFFQGSTPVGDSQVISVRAGGTPEEVYVDFTVPSGAFNIRAEIRATDPADQQPSNNVAITNLFTPIMDDDRDGIANELDNCPSAKNANQADADRDGMGDSCDPDDDNDGLSDDVETELGTDRTKKDTDSDGVNDPDDAYPLDGTKTKEPPPAPAPVQTPKPTPSTSAPKPTAAVTAVPSALPTPTSSAPLPGDAPSDQVEVTDLVEETSLLYAGEISPGAVFSYSRVAWNQFHFEVLAPLREGERLEWDFGDGATSGLRAVDHIYRASGSYTVEVRRVAADGTVSEDHADVDVPFFTLNNRLVLAAIGVLLLALLAGGLAAFRLRGTHLKKREEE